MSIRTEDPKVTGSVIIQFEGMDPLELATFVLPSDVLGGSGDPSFPYRLRIAEHSDAPQLVQAIAAALASTPAAEEE